jgi:hypothetical protein
MQSHAFLKAEKAERKGGAFTASAGPISEGTMAEDYNTQASSTTVKNPNGHRSPHNPNTPYTNMNLKEKPNEPKETPWSTPPVAQPSAAALFEQQLAKK